MSGSRGCNWSNVTELDRFLPALALAVLLSVPAGYLWARLANVGLLLGMGTALGLFVILAFTLSPALPLPESGTPGACSFGVMRSDTQEVLGFGEAILNVALFAPFAFALAFYPRTRARTFLIGATFALPFAIELGQLGMPSLGRYCDTMDIADNLLGTVVGFSCGAVIATAARAVRRLWGGRGRRAGAAE
jgi:VanZ like family